ncbi:MAG: 8-amino-7-oxononanoate synthase [Rhodanobacteraceae bacterium]
MSGPALLARLEQSVAMRAEQNLLRSARALQVHDAVQVRRDGRLLTVFCSNDYLGLARHPALVQALQQAAAAHGVGSTAAHLICGHQREHAMLEEALAAWTGRERALLFSTGVMANAGVMQALLKRGDLCVQDRYNHASLLDGARLSGARLKRYPHRDSIAAARQLDTMPGAAALLATDGVFSMHGDLAPLLKLTAACDQRNALLMVDDAHGLGVNGPRGAGSVLAAGLDQSRVPVLMGTLGKALGCFGAFVAGSSALIEGLTQFAHSYIYTTAPPPALAAAARVALGLAQAADDRRQKLAQNIARFRSGARQLGLALGSGEGPIQPLPAGDSGTALAAARHLEIAGFLVTAIRPPTVPPGQARLRIALSAAHSADDIDQLLDALSTLPFSEP